MPAIRRNRALPAPRTVERSLWLPIAVAALALGVRLVRLGERSLWLDEAFAVSLSRMPLPAIRDADAFFPPLYPLLLKGWTSLGPWFASDAGVRLPSALASAAAAGIAVWLTQRLRLPGVWLVGALSVLVSLSVWYAQEARSVALAGCALLVSGTALALVVGSSGADRGRPLRGAWGIWGVYSLAALSALYLHYDAVPVLILQNCWFIAVLAVSANGLTRAVFRRWILAQVVVVVFYGPQVVWLVSALRSIDRHPYALTYAPFAAALGLVVMATPLAWVAARRTLPRWLGVVSWAVVGGFVALYIAELVPAGTTIKRHVAVVFPVAVVPAAAVVAARLRPRWQVALVVAALPSLLLSLFVHPKEPWREVAAALQATARPGDTVAVYAAYVGVPLERYFLSQRSGQVVLLDDPQELAGIAGTIEPPARLWLVESHVEDVGKGSPNRFLPADWGLACESRFYRIALRRFERIGNPAANGQRSSPPRCP